MAEIISATKILKKCGGNFYDSIVVNNIPPTVISEILIRSEFMTFTN